MRVTLALLFLSITVNCNLIKEDPLARSLEAYRKLPKLHPDKLRDLTEGFQTLLHMHLAHSMKMQSGKNRRVLGLRHMFTDKVKQSVNGQIVAIKADIKGSQKLSVKVKGYVDEATGYWTGVKDSKKKVEDQLKNAVAGAATEAIGSLAGKFGFRMLEGEEEGGEKKSKDTLKGFGG